MNSAPSVYILAIGVILPVSQKSYSNRPRVSDGQEAGSTAMKRVPSRFPESVSRMNGAISPPRLLPPPAQPMIMSGYSPNSSSAV